MSKKKTVLEEEQYVEHLEQIIERDFFPDLPALRRQQALLGGDAATGSDPQLTATTLVREADMHATPASVRSHRHDGVSEWDQPTPTRHSELVPYERREPESDAEFEDTDPGGTANMTLNRFVSTHTSEDNESFNVLQEKTVEEHKQRYHWAFDVDEQRGDPKLHLLSDGTWISKEQRRIVDEVCAPKGLSIHFIVAGGIGLLDNRPSAPDTWRYRAQNPLLFPPELEATRDICQVESKPKDQLLLENGVSNRSGRPPKAKKVTVYANTRLPGDEYKNVTTAGGNATGLNAQHEYKLVQMTPSIVPGVDASPLMTWGEIEGTPLIVDGNGTPARISSGPMFEVKETPRRELLANQLEAQSRARKARSSKSPTPLHPSMLPSGSRKRPGSELSTGPPRSIRERLTSLRSSSRTPFGSDLELRASYSTPLRHPPRPSAASTKSTRTPK